LTSGVFCIHPWCLVAPVFIWFLVGFVIIYLGYSVLLPSWYGGYYFSTPTIGNPSSTDTGATADDMYFTMGLSVAGSGVSGRPTTTPSTLSSLLDTRVTPDNALPWVCLSLALGIVGAPQGTHYPVYPPSGSGPSNTYSCRTFLSRGNLLQFLMADLGSIRSFQAAFPHVSVAPPSSFTPETLEASLRWVFEKKL
jgi:hypothetical protein